MNEDRMIAIVGILGALLLFSGGLVHRNLAGRTALRLALTWVGIILIAWGVVAVIQRLQS